MGWILMVFVGCVDFFVGLLSVVVLCWFLVISLLSWSRWWMR